MLIFRTSLRLRKMDTTARFETRAFSPWNHSPPTSSTDWYNVSNGEVEIRAHGTGHHHCGARRATPFSPFLTPRLFDPRKSCRRFPPSSPALPRSFSRTRPNPPVRPPTWRLRIPRLRAGEQGRRASERTLLAVPCPSCMAQTASRPTRKRRPHLGDSRLSRCCGAKRASGSGGISFTGAAA